MVRIRQGARIFDSLLDHLDVTRITLDGLRGLSNGLD